MKLLRRDLFNSSLLEINIQYFHLNVVNLQFWTLYSVLYCIIVITVWILYFLANLSIETFCFSYFLPAITRLMPSAKTYANRKPYLKTLSRKLTARFCWDVFADEIIRQSLSRATVIHLMIKITQVFSISLKTQFSQI